MHKKSIRRNSTKYGQLILFPPPPPPPPPLFFFIFLSFPENHNYFPDTIYYTATGQRVRDYTKETQRLIDEAGPSSVSDTTTAITTPVVATSVTTVVESPVSAAVEPVVSTIVDKRSPETTLVRRATVTAATSTS